MLSDPIKLLNSCLVSSLLNENWSAESYHFCVCIRCLAEVRLGFDCP